LLVFLVSSTDPLAASPYPQNPNSIILPADGQVLVNFVGTGGPGEPTACEGDFGLSSPNEQLIFPEYLYYAGLPMLLQPYYESGTELVFYIEPRDFCTGGPFYSTDPERAIVTHLDENTWIIGWEDHTDADFNDLIVRIEFYKQTIPFLDLPF
jgi:hypothetical protein